MPCQNPNGRPLAPPPASLCQMALVGTATTAMQQAGLPDEDVQRMRLQVSRSRSALGALRNIARWVDLGMPVP